MRIGIDLAPLSAARTGIPVYARSLLTAMSAARPDWRYAGFSLRGWRDVTAALPMAGSAASRDERARARLTGAILATPVVPEARLALRRLLFERLPQPPIDLFYALNFLPPGRIEAPVVPVIHDLYHLEAGNDVHPARRHALARLADVAAAAPRVQAVSRFTAGRIADLLGVDPGRIDVVAPILRDFFRGPPPPLPAGIGLTPRRYWLAVGMAERRKNLDLLVEVMADRPDLCAAAFPLVLVGPPAWQGGGRARQLARMIEAERVRHLGFVGDRELHALYGHAASFLMPSLHEGFGIPVIEALASGAAVVASDNSALPEASGGHAVHLPARDAGAWAQALERMKALPPQAAQRAAGRAHALSFTAQAAADAAVASLERAVA